MIKILFVLNNINIGGPQKSLLALLDNIDYSKFDVHLLVLEPGGALQRYYNSKVKILETPPLITAATLPRNNTAKHLFYFLKKGNIKMFLSALVSIIKCVVFKKNMNQERQAFWKNNSKNLPLLTEKYDLAFGVSAGLTTYYIVDCVKAICRYHWVRSDYRILGLNKNIEEEYFKRVDGSLAVSQECADIFINEFNFMKGKVKVFYNFIPISFYEKMDYDNTLIEKESENINILTVCRLDPLKGIDMAIEACENLIRKGKKVKWYILGGGRDREVIELEIKNRGLENSFHLLGFQYNTLAFIKECDIFVHPSRTEGKSNAVDEAKYIGKPIVVTNYDTVKEQVENGVTGIVCGMSGKEIAYAVEMLLENNNLRKKLIENCKNHIDNDYNLSNYLTRLIN